MKRALLWIARLMILSFTMQSLGCASIERSASDTVHVQSPDPAAKLSVNYHFIGTGSGAAIVKRDHASTIWAEKNLCATTIQDTGSKFNPRSIRDYTNGAPLLSALADAMGVTQDTGTTSPLNYTVRPTCLPATSQTVS